MNNKTPYNDYSSQASTKVSGVQEALVDERHLHTMDAAEEQAEVAIFYIILFTNNSHDLHLRVAYIAEYMKVLRSSNDAGINNQDCMHILYNLRLWYR